MMVTPVGLADDLAQAASAAHVTARTPAVALVATPGSMLSRHPRALEQLAPYEIEKARSIRSVPSRCSYIAAHLLVREAAARLAGVPAAAIVLTQRCADCGGPHGQPFIVGHPRLHVSLSHCDLAVAAVASWSPVAIDVEDGAAGDELLAGPVFSTRERALLAGIADRQRRRRAMLRCWVRKECLIKLGRLSLDTLADCDLSDLPDGSHDDGMPTVTPFGGLRYTDWTHAQRRVTGAVLSEVPVTLDFVDWPADIAASVREEPPRDIASP